MRTPPALAKLLKACERGKVDVVVVWKIDRLGRNLAHLLATVNGFTEKGIAFCSIRDAGIDTTSASGRLLLQLLGSFAQFERALLQERVIAGVRRAQANGVHCGRPRKRMDIRPALALFEQGYGLKKSAGMLGVSSSTLKRRLIEAGEWPREKRTNGG